MKPTPNAIILVAGEGKRLLPFTLTEPKCFARVDGVRILENALRGLAANGCEHVRIVVGHHAGLVRAAITAQFAGLAISYVENRDYATTNSMYSLALGLADCEGPTWVLEGDVFFEPSVLQVATTSEIAWLVDSSLRSVDGAFVEADANGMARSLKIVRDLSLLNARQSKSVGILRLSPDGLELLRGWLRDGVTAGRRNVYYDLIVSDHLHEGHVSVVDVAGKRWFEIDTHADLAAATRIFNGEQRRA